DVDRAELGRRLLAAAVSADSGLALVALTALLAASAEALVRSGRRSDGMWYGAGSMTAAVISVMMPLPTWPEVPGRLACVCGLYGAACLAWNGRLRAPLVGRMGLGLVVLASVWGMHWLWPGQLQLWALGLAIECLVLSVQGFAFRRLWQAMTG